MNPLGAELPAGMAEPLHIFPLWTSTVLGILLGLLIAAIVTALLVYLIRKNRTKSPTEPSPLQTTVRQSGFGKLVASIRNKHEANQTYREGCHDLSAALKAHLEQRTGLDVEEMTAREIGRHFPQKTEAYFAQLSRLQFGVKEPDLEDFLQVCNDAGAIAKTRANSKTRPRRKRMELGVS